MEKSLAQLAREGQNVSVNEIVERFPHEVRDKARKLAYKISDGNNRLYAFAVVDFYGDDADSVSKVIHALTVDVDNLEKERNYKEFYDRQKRLFFKRISSKDKRAKEAVLIEDLENKLEILDSIGVSHFCGKPSTDPIRLSDYYYNGTCDIFA